MKMKKFWLILLTGSLALLLFAGCGSSQNTPAANANGNQSQDKKISVYTSFYPMYDFALKIGGDKVQVVNMVPVGTEPHDWEPTAADITGLEKAAVFIYNGAGMEHWVENILEALQNKDLIVVEASKGIDLIKGHSEHADQEDLNGAENRHQGEEYDPHVWLNPLNAKREMENIKNAFIQADPENKDFYEANFQKYAAELDKLDKEFQEALSTSLNKNIIVAHQAFTYLCAAYGLNQVPIAGLSPDSEPDPARMAEIIDFAKKYDVTVIFFEELASPKVAETIASAVHAEVGVLNPLEGLSGEQQAAGDDYFSVMRQNLQALKAALQ